MLSVSSQLYIQWATLTCLHSGGHHFLQTSFKFDKNIFFLLSLVNSFVNIYSPLGGGLTPGDFTLALLFALLRTELNYCGPDLLGMAVDTGLINYLC